MKRDLDDAQLVHQSIDNFVKAVDPGPADRPEQSEQREYPDDAREHAKDRADVLGDGEHPEETQGIGA